jgi:hypothetical protein
MADGIFEPEFRREAAELTRKLELGQGYLLRDGVTGAWSLWSRRNGFASPVGKVADSLISEMRALDRLKPRPGGGLILASEAAKNKIKIEIAGPDGRIVTAERNEAECALDWLRGRKDQSGDPILSEEQFAAAERLRGDYTLAHLGERVTASWDFRIEQAARGRSGDRSPMPLSDKALAAKDRLFKALSHVGPELSGILLEVCCMAGGLEHAERLLGLPRRSGKAILGMALTRLARHYGLLPDEPAKLPEARLRHWAAPDYRPRIA